MFIIPNWRGILDAFKDPIKLDDTRPAWTKFTLPEQAKAAVATRHADCREIETEIEALRTRKKILNLEIAAIEQAEFERRPPNPLGSLRIG